ncbi:MAG: Gfo/Idh/MocA family oxidoreductase [Bacteroidetes bacterium]|nr:Gfo/Idh/MocA family oxidoreductase [Bacteroidota bacterium]
MKVKFAVLGTGHIGKRHAEMISRNPAAELVALADISPKNDLGVEIFGVPFYNSLQSLLAEGPDFDVLNIATPNGLHGQHAIAALKANKHVVIEKPMALSKAECEQVVHNAMAHHKLVFCVMQNRYSPPSVWIKDLLNSGKLGKIFMVQVNCYWNRDERYYKAGNWKGLQVLDGGTLFTQFSHFIDIMYWLFGDITDIRAQFEDFIHKTNTEFEDSGMIQFRFLNGGLGCINYSTSVWDKNFESSVTIIAENGTVKIGGQYMNEVEYCHIKDYTMPELPPANPANDYGHYKGSAANHNFVIENVVDTINRNVAPTTNALEGLKVVEIIERIYASNPYPESKKYILDDTYPRG